MDVTSFRIRTAVAAILVLSALGCGPGTDTTGPTEEHPAIPFLTESNSNCAVWSCSSGQCAQDPAIYGACCTTITDPGETGAPKPANCDAPPGGTPSWCMVGSPRLSCINHPTEGNPHPDCTQLPLTGNTGEYYPECGGNL